MEIQNMKQVGEIAYWVALVAIGAVVYFRKTRKGLSDYQFKKGQEEARQYLDGGVLPSSIEAFLRMQRNQGYYGPHEAGMESVLRRLK